MRRWLLVALCNIGVIVLFLGLAEVAGRIAFPCALSAPRFPSSFVPGLGTLNEPNALVLDTNGFDYCVEQRVNSLGFLDTEPPAWSSIKDKLRVALVGDSVVEGSTVRPEQKLQNRLHSYLAAAGVDAHVSAWGKSGYGQVQELAAFEKFALPLHPNIVVIVIVYNDLKNNSWLLEALQDGYLPNTPYNVEIRPVLPESYVWEVVEPRPGNVELLPHGTPQKQPLWAQLLKRHSALYGYAVYLASWNYPRVLAMLTGEVPNNPLPERIRYLSRDPEIAPLLVGWPADIDVDHIDLAFEHHPWPSALDLAVRATAYIMDRWVALSRREGFKLVALLRSEQDGYFAQAAAWRRILEQRDIPIISEREFLAKHKYNPEARHFLRDGHWSAQGHRWAAESIAEFLLQQRQEYLIPYGAVPLSSH